ncbi:MULTISPECIES: TadE family protein [unclassified Streptomyces]|uniref:TadE family protein n=1 Tax=Streptomycetaceae TaxID=2062 RepID=UPI002E7AA538|nr:MULTISPECIES: TadE family protein [unclassified Streptomyces]MED7949506.1 pilus assembly protein [Streptomyces sp. BE303]MEE1824482.1 pilus assembly protein [Streptomyces sp. BE20]
MSLGLAIVFPVVLILILSVAQTGLWWYYRQLALTAAREGVDAGRVQGNRSDELKNEAARKQAEAFLGRQGSEDHAISTDGSTPVLIRVTVEVTAPVVIPFVTRPTVTQRAEAPRERFVPPQVVGP